MEKISPYTENDDATLDSDEKFFDPCNNQRGFMVCCCGYELFKHDENTYKCSGGNHTYRLQDGDVVKDKNGNILFRIPGETK